MLAVVTGNVTEPAVPAVSVPLCAPTATVLAGAAIVSVKGSDVVPSIVSVRVAVSPAKVVASPARVNVPELPLIVTIPETDTPVGRLATVAV